MMLREAETSTSARLVLETTLAVRDPAIVTDHFTDPDLLTAWWAGEAKIDTETGDYMFVWPEQGWTLRGRFLERVPGQRVGFTWRWDHEPELPPRTVLVTTEAVPEGTRLTITHGDYTPDDQDERADHLAGWMHFIGRLADRIA
jgi:uncharacterized protein YndB with AHSA1/START domain